MNDRMIELLENIEEKIENIKWRIIPSFSFRKGGISPSISIIRKSSGILGKGFPKGDVFENKARKEWKAGFIRRIS